MNLNNEIKMMTYVNLPSFREFCRNKSDFTIFRRIRIQPGRCRQRSVSECIPVLNCCASTRLLQGSLKCYTHKTGIVIFYICEFKEITILWIKSRNENWIVIWISGVYNWKVAGESLINFRIFLELARWASLSGASVYRRTWNCARVYADVKLWCIFGWFGCSLSSG